MRRKFRPLTQATCGRLVWVLLLAGMTAPVFANGMAMAEESVFEPVDILDMPLPAIRDIELDGQFGLGLSAIESLAGSGERLAVILWDETKPRQAPPGIGLQSGSVSASGSITVSSGGRYGH